MRFNIEMDNLCAQAVQKKEEENGYQICTLVFEGCHHTYIRFTNI